MASTSAADAPKPGFVPAKQRAWRIVRKGEPAKALVLDNDAPIPTLKSGEILVRVQAVSFHYIVYSLMVMLPNSLLKRNAELEFSGEVVDADASTGFAPGDKVSGFVAPDTHITKRRGALAQYIAVKPGEIVKRPDFLTTNEASGVLGVGLTAYQALFEIAKLRQEPGQSVFINGGSTSVGMYAIQIAKSYGLKVTASASPRNAKLVEELGAEVVDYTTAPLHETLTERFGSDKFDAFIEAVGMGDTLLYTHSGSYLKPEGAFVGCGPKPNGFFTALGFLWDFRLRPRWLGGTKRRFAMVSVHHSKEESETIFKLLSEGKVKHRIDSVYAFEDVLKAYEKVVSSRAVGKVVIEVPAAGPPSTTN